MRGRWSQGGEQQVGHPELEEASSRGPDGLKNEKHLTVLAQWRESF